MTNDRGGPVDGERSISGRACLPIALAMIGLGLLLVGSVFTAIAGVLS